MVHVYNDNYNDDDNDNTTYNNNNINNELTFGLTQYLGYHIVGHVYSTEIWDEYLNSSQLKSLKITDIQRKWKTLRSNTYEYQALLPIENPSIKVLSVNFVLLRRYSWRPLSNKFRVRF